eukprot:1126077-Rhodomonas_salina.1
MERHCPVLCTVIKYKQPHSWYNVYEDCGCLYLISPRRHHEGWGWNLFEARAAELSADEEDDDDGDREVNADPDEGPERDGECDDDDDDDDGKEEGGERKEER